MGYIHTLLKQSILSVIAIIRKNSEKLCNGEIFIWYRQFFFYNSQYIFLGVILIIDKKMIVQRVTP